MTLSDTLPTQCEHIKHMHEGIWSQNIEQIDSNEVVIFI